MKEKNIKSIIRKVVEYGHEQKECAKKLIAAVKDRLQLLEEVEKMKKRIEEGHKQSISALVNVIKAKDIELYRHSVRVARHALKIAVKDRIPDKPGKLDESEYSQIKLEARIISVADAYDALTSDRVYRSGLDKEVACKILRMGKNRIYDPDIADLFLGGMQNG